MQQALSLPEKSAPLARLRAALLPHRLALAAITLVSVFCNFWMLGQNGYGNLYYAAAVKSMGANWHAFFFVSLDSAGFVSVDKPPLGFWLQVLSTKIFGFTPFALFLPQAVAGVLAVVLLYWLVRRHFGQVAGLVAALVLAVSPISVVTNRNNTIDSTLMLALLVGAWATFHAIETGKLKWLLLTAVCVGLGFNIKMLEAYLVVPAFTLAFLLGADLPWLRRLGHLALAGLAMVALSLSWVLAVDLIPASLRPYVGSTQNNSELSLAFGYNGLQRLTGGGGPSGSGGAPGGGPPADISGGAFPGGPPGSAGFPGGSNGPGSLAGNGPGGAGAGGGSVGMFNTGNPGLFRLFTQPLAGQIVWLLPLALLGMLALAADRRFRPRADRQQQSLILWGTWLLTMVVFFSVATFFHQYYLSQMTPAVAAMAGIGLVTMWHQFLLPGWRGWLLPLALAVTAVEQIFIISSDPTWGTWLIPLVAIPAAVAAIALTIFRLRPSLARIPRLRVGAVALGFAALLAVPTVWSAYPALANVTQNLPIAGLDASGGPGGSGTASQTDSALISYLAAHQGSATYLVATTSSNTSAPIILATDKAVMTLGGFNGNDPILTVAQLQALIAKGTVRYFLLDGAVASGTTSDSPTAGGFPGGGNGGSPGGTQSSLTQWVAQNCTTVLYQSTTQTTQGGFGPGGGNQQLYDCAGK